MTYPDIDEIIAAFQRGERLPALRLHKMLKYYYLLLTDRSKHWRHYKNDAVYEVLGCVLSVEGNTVEVLYRPVGDPFLPPNAVFSRAYDRWEEDVVIQEDNHDPNRPRTVFAKRFAPVVKAEHWEYVR